MDMYSDIPGAACHNAHTLFDASPGRNPPGGTYLYTCPATQRDVTACPAAGYAAARLTPPGGVEFSPGGTP